MLTIPDSQRPIVRRLISLPPDQFKLLKGEIAKAQPALSLSNFADQIAHNAKLGKTEAMAMLRVVGVLQSIREDEQQDAREIARNLVDAARLDRDIEPPDGDWQRVTSDLTDLIASSSVGTTFKAGQLVGDHQHSYCATNSRVISDIRAIFPVGEISQPIGAIIVHMLKVAYHQDERADSKEFFVALDSDDLRHLRDLLDRAMAKEVWLKKLIQASNTPLVNSKEE